MIKSRAMLRLATLATLVLYCSTLPINSPLDLLSDSNDRPEIIEIIAPAAAAQETLDSLNLGEPNAEASDRNKRTIGILRQLFPNLSQIIDMKIQAIIGFLIRTVGRNLLAGAIGGGGGNTNSGGDSDSGDKVSISLPAFDDDDDDDDDDSDEDEDDTKTTSTNMTSPFISNRFNSDSATESEVQTNNLEDTSSIEPSSMTPTPSNNEVTEYINTTLLSLSDNFSTTMDSISSSNVTSSESMDSSSSLNLESSETSSTLTSLATIADNNDSENQLAGAESQHNEVRVQFTDPDGTQKDAAESKSENDQEGAASDTDGLALDDIDSPDENRDKRFLGGDSTGGSSSGGGSGNFLFDIIRRPAESMARAAGQAFRILTGTDSIGLGITATHTAVRDIANTNKLVAGSGGTEQSDEASNTTSDHDDSGKAADGAYSEGIPGPVTRFFIIANRGIANLVQDLILRLAQTSERIVNFKARLITSII